MHKKGFRPVKFYFGVGTISLKTMLHQTIKIRGSRFSQCYTNNIISISCAYYLNVCISQSTGAWPHNYLAQVIRTRTRNLACGARRNQLSQHNRRFTILGQHCLSCS